MKISTYMYICKHINKTIPYKNGNMIHKNNIAICKHKYIHIEKCLYLLSISLSNKSCIYQYTQNAFTIQSYTLLICEIS